MVLVRTVYLEQAGFGSCRYRMDQRLGSQEGKRVSWIAKIGGLETWRNEPKPLPRPPRRGKDWGWKRGWRPNDAPGQDQDVKGGRITLATRVRLRVVQNKSNRQRQRAGVRGTGEQKGKFEQAERGGNQRGEETRRVPASVYQKLVKKRESRIFSFGGEATNKLVN